MSDNAEYQNWVAALQAAAKIIQASPGAPAWLETAVSDALLVSLALMRFTDKEDVPLQFVYPH